MDSGIKKIERWNNTTKGLMFIGIAILTLIIFFGSFWLFFIKLSFNWILSLICVAIIFEIYNEGFLELVKHLINKYRYKEF